MASGHVPPAGSAPSAGPVPSSASGPAPGVATSSSEGGDAAAEHSNPQLLVYGKREPQKITGWATNHMAQEAVLECYSNAQVHIAPYGESGKRLKDAVENLRSLWGYLANERTITKWVTTMLDAHESKENQLDNETGTEYDRSPEQVWYSASAMFWQVDTKSFYRRESERSYH